MSETARCGSACLLCVLGAFAVQACGRFGGDRIELSHREGARRPQQKRTCKAKAGFIDRLMFGRAVRSIGRHRVAALATAVTAGALAASRADCRSVELDNATAASLAKSLSASLSGKPLPSTEEALAGASTSDIMEELRVRLGIYPKNTAYVFAKPHANTPAVLKVIESKFAEKGITILEEGVVTGEAIDKNGYIDQHYYAIAEKSTLTTGKDVRRHRCSRTL